MSRAPRTVLYVAWAPFFSGAERALLILLEHLDRSRYRPVAALGTRGGLEVELAALEVQTVHVPIAYTGLRTAPSWLQCVGRLAAVAMRERAAVVHANDVPSFQPAGYAARLLGRPAVTHVRFPDSRTGFGWFLRSGFSRALFVSAALRESALEEAPELFGKRSEVVYDGVRLPELPDRAAVAALRNELGLPANRTVVAFTGQVVEIKGIWDFVDAAGILVSRGLPVQFVVLGDDLKGKGAVRKRVEDAVAANGLSEHVRFLGFRPDAPRLIPAFDIIAVPSHVEPLGNATLEAMAAARPVVGSRVGGIPEMIVQGETGLLVDARTPSQLAAALEALVLDPPRARALGQAGRTRAERAFHPRKHAKHVESVYDRLLDANR